MSKAWMKSEGKLGKTRNKWKEHGPILGSRSSNSVKHWMRKKHQ